MTRRQLLGTFAAAAGSPPNFVLLLADDMRWGDPSCYGNHAVETPHLDALAAAGTRYENFYSASAVCSPSRAAILTGRYPIRFDIRRAFNDDETHLPLTATLPRLLKQAGYSTGHVGKWHLGGLHRKHIRNRAASIPGPHQHGFDHYQCQNEEQPLRGEMGRDRILFRRGGTCLIRDDQNVPPSDPRYHRHFTDTNGDEAVRLLDEFHARRKPFFLNVWFLAPHAPYEPAPEPFWAKAASPGISYDQKCYRSMVMHMDHQVGRILRRLDELGLREKTMVLFTSDNGGAWEANIGPHRGGKTDLHEGGIRVPGILSFPGRVAKGAVTPRLAHHCDVRCSGRSTSTARCSATIPSPSLTPPKPRAAAIGS
jgi:arylsulfatase A-like enzyme